MKDAQSSSTPPSTATPIQVSPCVPRPIVRLRTIGPHDSISEITKLLHRAYKPQVEMGLKPLAGRQGDDITADRAKHSECWLALVDRPASESGNPDKIVGIILFEEIEKVTFPPFFLRPEVAHFAQFAVDPDLQGCGIGRLLLDKVEVRARENKAIELALSMAEPDRKLYDFYINRGFRLVEYWQWPYTNYRSCILSKELK